MPTLESMVSRVKQTMYGYTQAQQQFSYLVGGIGSSDVTLTVSDPKQVTRGMIEIDGSTGVGELLNISSVDHNTGVATVIPGGRGWQGTDPSSHSPNAIVENNPVFPAIRIVEAINTGIRAVYPQVFATGTKKITKLSAVFEYDLPAEAEEVVSVYYQLIGPSKITVPMVNWQFNPQATTTDFSSGKAVYFGQEPVPGREIFVTYKKEPSEMSNFSDDFVSVTGLPSSVQDVVVWKACAALAPALDGPRLLLNTVEANERAAFLPAGSAAKVAEYWEQKADRRLIMESLKQYDRFQQNIHLSY